MVVWTAQITWNPFFFPCQTWFTFTFGPKFDTYLMFSKTTSVWMSDFLCLWRHCYVTDVTILCWNLQIWNLLHWNWLRHCSTSPASDSSCTHISVQMLQPSLPTCTLLKDFALLSLNLLLIIICSWICQPPLLKTSKITHTGSLLLRSCLHMYNWHSLFDPTSYFCACRSVENCSQFTPE